MKYSLRVARLIGIDVYVHVTLLILFGWVGIAHFLEHYDWREALIGLSFIGGLFVIIVLHEMGHALAARRFGIQTRDITLLPIGGIARMDRIPEEPKQELVVALAGPAVNIVLAAILYAVVAGIYGRHALFQVEFVGGNYLGKLMWINIGLAVFNLLPAFPMDGGRVLRAVLAMYTDYIRATQTAASIGQVMAFIFGFAGLLIGNPLLVFVAFFVWMGAAQEAFMTHVRTALGGIPVSKAMVTDFQTIEPESPLSTAVEHIVAGFQQDFPVVEAGRIVGMLTRSDLISGLAHRGTDTQVRDVMQTRFETAEPTEMLDNFIPRLRTCGCHSVPVVIDGDVVGIMTMEDLGEFLMIKSALISKGRDRNRLPKSGLREFMTQA